MSPSELKQALADGQVVAGTMVFEFNTPGIGLIAAEAGAEFVLYDMEHTGWSIESIRAQMAWSRSAPITRLVRVPATQYDYISRALDVGAQGVMAPMVESAEQATAIATASSYPPEGRRGAAFGIAHDGYAPGAVLDKMRAANAERVMIAQVETITGVKNAREIAAVPGIDILWVGQFDLTVSLEIPGQFDHPDFVAAVKAVADAARNAGKACGAMALSVDDAKTWVSRGYNMIAYSGDLWIYQLALTGSLRALRDAL
ncbi:MAG TPA: aldolase/citrate lyase family protein [Thermomicrobiales bacterium]|nr:aldolase/citrate lyase family protein [Thermomicrobiales bacterium]